MKIFGKNVGRRDAQSRQIAAVLLILGGVTALPVVHHAVLWLIWLLGAVMVLLSVRYIWLGMKGCGTTLFGIILGIFGVVGVLLASTGAGVVVFVIDLVLAIVGWLTAAAGNCPVNALLGLDTRDHAPRAPNAATPHPVGK